MLLIADYYNDYGLLKFSALVRLKPKILDYSWTQMPCEGWLSLQFAKWEVQP
jgi:hypothetical protein